MFFLISYSSWLNLTWPHSFLPQLCRASFSGRVGLRKAHFSSLWVPGSNSCVFVSNAPSSTKMPDGTSEPNCWCLLSPPSGTPICCPFAPASCVQGGLKKQQWYLLRGLLRAAPPNPHPEARQFCFSLHVPGTFWTVAPSLEIHRRNISRSSKPASPWLSPCWFFTASYCGDSSS